MLLEIFLIGPGTFAAAGLLCHPAVPSCGSVLMTACLVEPMATFAETPADLNGDSKSRRADCSSAYFKVLTSGPAPKIDNVTSIGCFVSREI